jgi:hypothetical protein
MVKEYQMKWMKIKSIKAAAGRGELSALKNCLRHHMQGRDATLDELRDSVGEDVFDLDSEHCAMCTFTDDKCQQCVLFDYACCGGQWAAANRALNTFRADPTTHRIYVREANKLCNYIESIIIKGIK